MCARMYACTFMDIYRSEDTIGSRSSPVSQSWRWAQVIRLGSKCLYPWDSAGFELRNFLWPVHEYWVPHKAPRHFFSSALSVLRAGCCGTLRCTIELAIYLHIILLFLKKLFAFVSSSRNCLGIFYDSVTRRWPIFPFQRLTAHFVFP